MVIAGALLLALCRQAHYGLDELFPPPAGQVDVIQTPFWGMSDRDVLTLYYGPPIYVTIGWPCYPKVDGIKSRAGVPAWVALCMGVLLPWCLVG